MILEYLKSKKCFMLIIVAVLTILGVCVVYPVVLANNNSGNLRNSYSSTTASPGIIINPPSEFTPCSHSSGDVVCDKVSAKEVENVFNRTSFHSLKSVKVTFHNRENETLIPEDVFGTKQILDIEIGFPQYNKSWLKVDTHAFRSTKNYTEIFKIENIDCTHLNLGFLSGFDQLTNLTFDFVHNIQHCLPSLPPLPSLTKLCFDHCYGMNQLKSFSAPNSGFKYVRFFGGDDINDRTVDRIMDQLLLSSVNTLEELEIFMMDEAMTRVPQNIASFKALSKLDLSYNDISTIKSGELSFSVPVSKLDIRSYGLRKIEPGAFQGDFKDARVSIYGKSLTRFEESAFGPILQQMASGKGFISFGKMDCSVKNICHLAWLRRYHRYLLHCSADNSDFDELSPSVFNHCPA